MRTPINDGVQQSDLDAAGFKITDADLGDYAGDGLTWNAATNQFESTGGGGGGTGLPDGWVSVAAHGGTGDARMVTDASISSGTTTLSSATAAFTEDDVGKAISINGVGVGGTILTTTIEEVTSSTIAVLATTASNSAGGQYCAFGTDNTTPVQDALAEATSVVYFPPGNYFFAGSIGALPIDKSLVGAPFFGARGAVMDTSAIYDESHQLNPMDSGTTFLLTANSYNASGDPFIVLSDNSSVTGITFYWPNQLKVGGTGGITPIAYPWAIHFDGGTAGTVKYCNFVNGYQCIYIENTLFSLVEEIRGQALYRGIKCEGNYDVTRLRGCHFNASWTTGGVATTQLASAIAFDFGRNDLLIAEGCFAFWYGTWIHFYDDPAHDFHGPRAAWAEIRGGGADWCTKPVWVEETQFQGVDIDGAHISTVNTGNVCVVIDSTATGSVRIKNSMMLAWLGTFGTVAGSGINTVDNCHFIGTGTVSTPTFATTGWVVTGTGTFTLRDNHFNTVQPYLSLGSGLSRAVVTGNMCGDVAFNVTNSMATGYVIASNTGDTGGGGTASMTSNEISTLVQVASAAATSANAHANTVSARAVSISNELGSLLASTSAALETHINAVSAAGVTGGASVTSQELSVLVQAASAAATSADAHANTVSARAVSISNELGSLLASASTALAARDNTISAAAAAADTHANTVSARAVSISAELASLIASGDAALSTRINTASALAGTADTHANTVSARAVSISNELGSLLASASTALEAHAVAASAAATSAINKAVSDNASLSAVLETHINFVSAAGVTGGASVTSNELASLVQIASLAATSADTHANTVSARAVSISNELGSLLASASTALAARDNTISAAAAAADTHANTVSARAVSISAELASLVQIVSARGSSISAELTSLLASTSAAISAQIVSVKASISLEYMSQINKLSASIQTASTAATAADTHANTVSARAVSISAELASLVQIASLAATSADTHANTVSARAVSISNELGSLLASADAALSLRVTSVAGLAGGGGSVTSTELSTARYIQNTTQTDVDYTASIGDALTLVKMSSASAHNFTVPPNGTVAFPTGTQIIVEQAGTATVTIVAGSGVTLEGGPLTTLGQYSTIVLIKQATNTWLVGNANTAAVSAEVLSIMSAADAALSSRITSVGGAVGGASATSAEIASLVQVASAAATAADTHANTVSARAVSISAELTSLLASSDTALSNRINSADTAVSTQAASQNNVISARVVSVSAELVSLLASSDAALSLRATSVEAHVNTVSARAVSISAELGSLLASTSAALIAADRSTSIVIKADVASVSTEIARHKAFAITVESPSAAENICFAFTTMARTVSKVHAVVGGTSPSVTYNIAYGTDVASTTTVTSTPAALTNTSTGTDASLKRVSIPANGFIVFKTTAQSGTVNFIHVTVDT